MRTKATYRQISAAIKLAQEQQHKLPTDCYCEVYYDRQQSCWYAQYKVIANQWDAKEWGNIGFGASPMDAVVALLENNFSTTTNQSN